MRLLVALIYLLINSLFVLKYGLRINTGVGISSLLVYNIFAISLLFVLFKKWTKKVKNVVFYISCAFLLLLIVAQLSIDPYTLKVDRWSAIHNFLHNLFSGIYPYAAKTHLGGYGSPFPVWQIVHIPFYLLGDVGLSIFFFFLLFVYSLKKIGGKSLALTGGILLLFSPAFIYECIVRSDMITNFMLSATIVNLFWKYHKSINNNLVVVACIIGLMLSTRLAAAIPFFVLYWREYFRVNIQRELLFPLIILSIFALTFIPFVFWNGDMLFFFQYNPFILQTRQGSPFVIVLFLIFLIYLSSTWNNKYSLLMRNTGLTLFLLVVLTFAFNMWQSNTWTKLFDSLYDISYFDMSLPFLVTFIALSYNSFKNSCVEHIEDK